MDKFLQFRSKFPNFYYHGYNILETENNIEIIYDFEIEGLTKFSPKWDIAKDDRFVFDKNDEILNNIIFNIGMVEVISYLKATCSKNLIIENYSLNEEQIKYYKKLYYNGLGEFLYRNKIEVNCDDFINIICKNNNHFTKKDITSLNGNLILIGGGKDSLVTLDLLSDNKINNACYILNPKESWINGVLALNYDNRDIFVIKRYIDTRLIELNKEGYLNGHTPLSALLATSSLLVAYLLKKKNICVSNESSANEATVKGTNINHQYSKSIEFENDFREYCFKYISESFNYFSVLRPLSEYQIAAHFSKLTHLHHIFHSCNLGSKNDVWCHECPKCLFIYLLFSPFLHQDELKSIFGVNMLEDAKNLPEFEKLIGVGDEKSFECVGSRAEINFAIKKTINKINDDKLPLLLQTYKEKYMNIDKNNTNFDCYFDENNNVPEYILNKIKKEMIK